MLLRNRNLILCVKACSFNNLMSLKKLRSKNDNYNKIIPPIILERKSMGQFGFFHEKSTLFRNVKVKIMFCNRLFPIQKKFFACFEPLQTFRNYTTQSDEESSEYVFHMHLVNGKDFLEKVTSFFCNHLSN